MKNFKKIATLFTILCMIFSMVACTANKQGETDSKGDNQSTGADTTIDVSGLKLADKSVIDGIKFGGKTFRLIMAYDGGESFNRMVEDFEKQYECKVDVKISSAWGEYVQNVAASQTVGEPYDIVYIHGDFFPSIAVSNLLTPLNSYLSNDDLGTAEKGGLTIRDSKYISVNNQLYGVSSNTLAFLDVFYYNKLLFKKSGLEDPLELYKKGEWTWDKFVSMGQQVSDSNKGSYFLGGTKLQSQWLYGTNESYPISLDESGNYVTNASDAFSSTIKDLYDLFWTSKIETPANVDVKSSWKSGKTYMVTTTTDGWNQWAGWAAASNAFGKSYDNVGMVPVPKGKQNKNNCYPAHSSQGWGAGYGSSDPRAAVAFAYFQSTYKDTSGDEKTRLPQKYQEVIDNILNTQELYIPTSGFRDSSGKSVGSYLGEINKKVIDEQKDPALMFTTYKSVWEKCLKDAMTAN